MTAARQSELKGDYRCDGYAVTRSAGRVAAYRNSRALSSRLGDKAIMLGSREPGRRS